MIRAIVTGLAILGLLFSCADMKKAQHASSRASAIPTLRIINDSTAANIKISSLQVDVTVAANIATTTFDISFYNPNDRVLEGELEFPLADGQHITRYALDINGKLREAVVVEKAKARVAFENTVRREIDPGLVEKTQGNNFRTRVYPIPAKGKKRIVIAIEEILEPHDGALFYQLPLYSGDTIHTFSLATTVSKSLTKPVPSDSCATMLNFNEGGNSFTTRYDQYNYIANKTISFSIPANTQTILTENYNGQTYFYIYDIIEAKEKVKKLPNSVAVLWDVSSSAMNRDLIKDGELLKKYLSLLGDVKVTLIPFNIHMQASKVFNISNGNAADLLKRINALEYDGGTQYGAIDISGADYDEILLFSDGLSTFGKKEFIQSSSPVITINSSPSADHSRLKSIAMNSHGLFIDLARFDVPTALKAMETENLQVVTVEYDKKSIGDLVLPQGLITSNGLSLSGKLIGHNPEVIVGLGYGNEVVQTRKFSISSPGVNEFDGVKKIWATMKIAELELEFEKNRQAVTALGKEFSIVTKNTSLLVLDRVEDYVQYEIVPPAELQKEYYSLLKEKKINEADEKKMAISEALAAMEKLKEWWNKSYSQKPKKNNNSTAVDTALTIIAPGESARIDATAVPFLTTDSLVTVGNTVTGDVAFSFSTTGRETEGIAPGVGSVNVRFHELALDLAEYKAEDNKIAEPSMELSNWKPGATYLATLEKTPVAEQWKKYLELKKEYRTQPSFFADVARFFAEKNEKKKALQVLSNIVEMKLESAELLRLVANYLMEINELVLAIETFKDVFQIREEEPQSYRDLALAYSEAGEPGKAIDLLYKLILGKWDGRFGDVKGIALNELNAVISANAGKVNTVSIDKRFIYPMPMDVRIVVGWNADNTDVDLWVTDPAKEKCFYQNTETSTGGKISADVTQGYGPEEFCQKKAMKGNYSVDVNLFGDSRQTIGGPITIKAEMFTDFGKPQQKRKTINFRVETNKEVVNIGSLKFGS